MPEKPQKPCAVSLKTDQFQALHLRRNPQWSGSIPGSNYIFDFSTLGDHIVISQPRGYAALTDVQQSLKRKHEVIRTGLSENAPLILIEDFQQLTGSALTARKHFINDLGNYGNLLALIFCNASPMMRLSIQFGKRIYPAPFSIHLVKTLAEAVSLAVEILGSKNIVYDPTFPMNGKKIAPGRVTQKEWALRRDDFSLRFEIIDGDILHPVPDGSLQKAHIDAVFETQKRAFEESGLRDGSYYLMSDLAAIKATDMETRRYFAEKLREWYRAHPFHMLIFYHANWFMRAAINISKTTAPYDVFIFKTFDEAMDLIARHRSARDESKRRTLQAVRNDIQTDVKSFDEILGILSSISWDAQASEPIFEKVDPDHPLRQIIEAVWLIKLDVDHLLAEKGKTEKTLIESRRRYKSILEHMEEGYYEVDLSGNLIFFNASLARILGYSEQEMLGMNYQAFSAKDDIEKIFTTFNQVYKTGRPASALDWKLIRKNGDTCFIETSVALIKNTDDQPCGFRGICRDISFKIEAEREKQKMADRLRQARKMEALGTLAGGVAHDLNNILSGIVSYPDLLLMKLPPDSPLHKPLATIKKSGERAAAIVQDLLTLARKGLPNREVININTMIIDYLKSPEHQYLMGHHPAVEVITNLDPRLLSISASPIHVIKILMNLVSNAAEAMPDGGRIHVITENFYSDIPMPDPPPLNKGEYVKLIIRDEGIGISDEDKERIFEPFYTKKTMGRSGSGLGMALVWGAVQDHNGHIDIQSAPGKGTAVIIFFPAVRAQSHEARTDSSLEKFKGKGETILVVDDLEDQRYLAAEMLTRLGYSVKAVPSGEAAVEHLKTCPADLVLLDMIMRPGINGLETYKKILTLRPSQKAIIVTGFSTSDRIKAAQSLGAGPCLKKPYLLHDMARIVREELDR